MWETVGWGVVVFLAAYGALTPPGAFLQDRYQAKNQGNTTASFALKLDELPASRQEVSETIDALLAERLAEKEIELTPAMRQEIGRDVVDELARENVVR